MKCQYCGNNLQIEDEVCPYCGKPNPEAAGQREALRSVREEYEQTRSESKKKSISAGRVGRLIVIGLMLAAIIYMKGSIRRNSDFDYRQEQTEKKVAQTVEKNKTEIYTTVVELERNRKYLALDSYMTNYRLRSNDDYDDFFRVFTAVVDYRVIFEDIMCLLDGFDGYQERTPKDWCDDLAVYITGWNSYVDGEFWNDSPTSMMHLGEHGEFLKDIKRDTRDIVQVYFDLTDEQAAAMWKMDKDELSELLYEKYQKLYR